MRNIILFVFLVSVLLVVSSCGGGGGEGSPDLPPTSTANWAITFTHRGILLPEEAVNFICDTVKPEIISWIQREADKYHQPYPFDDISCFKEQILLTGDLLSEDPGGLNEPAVINFLNDIYKEQKFVTIVHYLGVYEKPFYDHIYDSKYDFYFFKWYEAGSPPLYPPLDINNQGETLIHELMHKLGAKDKYSQEPDHACLIDPTTGQEYNGYDIMCHRIPDPLGGYTTPNLSELIVSEPTAREIGWLSE